MNTDTSSVNFFWGHLKKLNLIIESNQAKTLSPVIKRTQGSKFQFKKNSKF